MKLSISRKLGAFFLVIVMFVMAAAGHCPDEALAEAGMATTSCHAKGVDGTVSTTDHCPTCPPDGHSHGNFDCCANCPCQASLTAQPLKIDHNPDIAYLAPFDPFKALPEVYLTKFIPPQNLV